MSAVVEVPYEEIKDAFRGVEGLVQRVVRDRKEQIGDAFIEFTEPFVPKDTGELRESAKKVPFSDGLGIIYTRVNEKTGWDVAEDQYENTWYNHEEPQSAYWDREMLFYEGDNFFERVRKILEK